jgi:hypothetical protein
MVPEVARAPLQPPEAVQLSALAALHCSATDAPIATLVSLAFKLTNGGAAVTGVPVPVSDCDVSAVVLPPHATSEARAIDAENNFNANAYPDWRLRRIELMRVSQRLKLRRKLFRGAGSLCPQTSRSHSHWYFPIRQPVAVCKREAPRANQREADSRDSARTQETFECLSQETNW